MRNCSASYEGFCKTIPRSTRIVMFMYNVQKSERYTNSLYIYHNVDLQCPNYDAPNVYFQTDISSSIYYTPSNDFLPLLPYTLQICLYLCSFKFFITSSMQISHFFMNLLQKSSNNPSAAYLFLN